MVRPNSAPANDLVSLDEDCTSSSSLIPPATPPPPSTQQRRRASVSFSPTAIRAAMRSVAGHGDAEGGRGRRRRSQHKQPAVALQPPSSAMPPPPPRLPASDHSPMNSVRRRVSVSMGLGFRRAAAPHTPDQDSAAEVQVARSPSSVTQANTPSETKTRCLSRRLMRRGSSSLSPRSLQEAMNSVSNNNNNNNKDCPQESESRLLPSAILPGGSPTEPQRSQRRRCSASLSPSSLRAAVRRSARALGDETNRGADAGGAGRVGRAGAMDSKSVRLINSPKEAGAGGIQGKRSGRRSMSLAFGDQLNSLGLPLPLSSPSNASRGSRPSGPGIRERLRQRASGDGKGRVRSLSPPPGRGSRRGTIWMGSELLPFEAAQMVSSEKSTRAVAGGLGVRDDRGRAHSLLAAVPASKRSKVLTDLHER